MEQTLQRIKQQGLEEIAAAADSAAMEAVKVKYFGKKGELTQLLRGMGSLSAEERPVFGQKVNQLRGELETAFEEKSNQIRRQEIDAKIRAERIDVTLRVEEAKIGKLHPLTTVLDDILEVFESMGFAIESGREIETDYYNFQALNIPQDHPARDMQDTFDILH
jgi:phenylalanyl-tRNA synthetase alpha chain